MSNKYQRVFSHGEGLLILDELIANYQQKVIFDKDNQYQTAFNLGAEDVIKYILARVDTDEIED